MMTIFSLTDCCHLLAIDPKTFRRWLGLAQLSVHPHPLDARMKGVTRAQLLQVAALHRRTLPDLEGDRLLQTPTSRMDLNQETEELPTPALSTIDLLKTLTDLPTQIAALQHQLALLTEQVQQERQQRVTEDHMPQELSLPVQEPVLASTSTVPPASLEMAVDRCQPNPQPTDRRRQHAHVLPVVEYGAQGDYVVICPQQGVLSLQPDSPEWFAWLETLPSFRFVGQLGRLTAHRGYLCPPGTPWRAHRQIRNHTYNHRLGKTECLTIAALEQAAAALQSHLN